MLVKKLNLIIAMLGTTGFTLLSTVNPDIAQAQRVYAGTTRPGDRYASDFRLRTGVKDIRVAEPNLGRFNQGVGGFQITDNLNPANPVLVTDSDRDYLNLESKIPTSYPRGLARNFARYNITNFSGPIYEYTFFVDPSFPLNTLQPNGTPLPLGTDNSLRWYVPQQFTYTDPGTRNSFTFNATNNPNGPIDLINCLGKNSPCLGGFSTILEAARAANILTITFPGNVPLIGETPSPPGSVGDEGLSGVEFSTIPIPESNSSTSLIIFGLVGGMILFKKKISD